MSEENKKTQAQAGNIEDRILDAARQVFIEKGYEEASMSDIAARAGINRPALHYYYRTKDKMFEAVFGPLIRSIAPRVQDIMMDVDAPIGDRADRIAEVYFSMIRHNPSLPLFIMKESQRDPEHMFETIRQQNVFDGIYNVVKSLEKEMAEGKMRKVPVIYVLYGLVGLITVPFVTLGVAEKYLFSEGDTLDAVLEGWKPYVVKMIEALLSPEK